MASCGQMHARIRLNFVNSPLDSIWMLVDYKKSPLISDIVYEINKRYFGGQTDLSLSLHGSRLPLEEGSLLLRDEDAVTVRVEKALSDSTSAASGVISPTTSEVKKRGKRKHEGSDSEDVSNKKQSSHHSSTEGKHAKKKRKKEQKKKEKERLKEIADIVSSYTDVSRSYSSKHESSKESSVASKKSKHDDSHSRDKIIDDSTRMYAEISKQKSDSESDKQDVERKHENSHQKSDSESHHEKHKRKRIRKHKKRQSRKSSLEKHHNADGTSQAIGAEAAKWDKNVQPYAGNTVNEGQIFYGALPDKLLQPKYYRHQYHNLRKYPAQPNTHTKFHSDSENEGKEETHNLEQYNFLCSTRYSEFQEPQLQPPNTEEIANNPFASPSIIQNNFNVDFSNTTPDFQSSSTPNTSENAKESVSLKTDTNVHYGSMNGDLSKEFRQENVTKTVDSSLGNKNNSNINVNGSLSGWNGQVENRQDSSWQAAAPTALVQSVLPNGVTVFSRQRRGRPKAEVLTKEQQLNDVATNRSFIVQNPVQPESIQNEDFKVDPGETLQAEKYINDSPILPSPLKMASPIKAVKKDYSTFPVLAGPPRIGDKIAYRILEMSAEYTPEVSNYKEAEVLNYDQATQNVHLKSLSKPENNKYGNKFDISIEYGDTLLTNVEEESDEAMFHWTSLLEPRLVS